MNRRVPGGAAVLLLGLVTAGCGGSGSKAAARPSTTTVVRTTTTTALLPDTTAAPTTSVPNGRFVANRSTKGSPLGVVCWTFGEITLSSVEGAGGAPDGSQVHRAPDPAGGLARLDALLKTGAADLDGVIGRLPAPVQPFAQAMSADLVAVRQLRAAQLKSHVPPRQALNAIFESYFNVGGYDAVQDFQDAAAGDENCNFEQ